MFRAFEFQFQAAKESKRKASEFGAWVVLDSFRARSLSCPIFSYGGGPELEVWWGVCVEFCFWGVHHPNLTSNKATANREKENLGQYSFKWAVKSSKTATGAGPRASTVFEFGAI